MRLTLSLVLMFFLSLEVSGQEPTKWEKSRAGMFTSYISQNMDLNDEQKEFVRSVMLERIHEARKEIKGNNLSSEEKQRVYRTAFANAQTKLEEEFDKKTARKIMSLSNEARKNADKK